MKEQIRELMHSYGADLCGFASIGRFANAPLGFNPADIYLECKTAINASMPVRLKLSVMARSIKNFAGKTPMEKRNGALIR